MRRRSLLQISSSCFQSARQISSERTLLRLVLRRQLDRLYRGTRNEFGSQSEELHRPLQSTLVHMAASQLIRRPLLSGFRLRPRLQSVAAREHDRFRRYRLRV